LKPSSTDRGSFTDTMLGVGFELNRLTVEDEVGFTVMSVVRVFETTGCVS
jgi:hypothetical protein